MNDQMINAQRVEALKTWYALFGTILDLAEWTDEEKMVKLRQLRTDIDEVIARG